MLVSYSYRIIKRGTLPLLVYIKLPPKLPPFLLKNKKVALGATFKQLVVVWAGIEPATQGFSVLCSTD